MNLVTHSSIKLSFVILILRKIPIYTLLITWYKPIESYILERTHHMEFSGMKISSAVI